MRGGDIVEIMDLKILKSVAKHQSISKAAEELNYVQSHITAKIKQLEEKLNTKLFHRHSRGTELNSEGEKLLSYANKILSLVEEATLAVSDSTQPSGHLDIGTVETILKLPTILATFHQTYPNAHVSLTNGVTKELIQKTINKKVEGAFVSEFDGFPELEQHPVCHEELVIISNEHDLTTEDLKYKPYLVSKEGCSYRSKLEQWLKEEGVEKPRLIEYGALETILGGVVSGLGLTIISKSSVEPLIKSGVIKSYALPKQYSHILNVFIWRKDTYLTVTMKKFIDTVNQAKKLQQNLYPHLSVISNEKLSV